MPLLALCLQRTPYELTHTLTWSKAAISLQLPKCCPRVTSTLPHPSVDQHKSTAEQIEVFVAVPQDRIRLRQLSQLSSRANQLIFAPKQRHEQVRTNKKQYYLIHHKATKERWDVLTLVRENQRSAQCPLLGLLDTLLTLSTLTRFTLLLHKTIF